VRELEEKGIESEKINTLIFILDTCEFARFAPSTSGAEATKIYDSTSSFIKSVENSID
jgi:hypothetical protein